MKTFALLSVLAFCLLFVGCNNGGAEELKTFINEKGETILQMGKKIEENPTEAGVDEARKVFETKMESLKAQRDALRQKLPKYGDLPIKLSESDVHDTEMLNAIQGKIVMDRAADKKFGKLRDDFKTAVK
ncbi:MAG TPA: hypothetical protein VM095_12985 [Pyrinomonadaceae bacterium]|nr:hypothetical protein [Pyrinomonadaceae bacterium]